MKPLAAVYYLIIFSVIIIFAVDIIATKVLFVVSSTPSFSLETRAGWKVHHQRVMELFSLEKAFKIFYSNCIEMG